MKKLLFIPLLSAGAALAQDKPALISQAAGENIHMKILVIVCLIVLVLIMLICLMLARTIKILSTELKNPSPRREPASERMLEYDEWAALQKEKPGIWSRILGLKPLSQEKDIMLDHEFDGIAELDNPTPAWFMWLFYSTIAFAAVYLLYFHVLGYGKMQEDEYVAEMQLAAAEHKAYLLKSAGGIDENSVKASNDPSVTGAGAALFKANCVACHGDKGQGLVGPNLADEFWLHGGKINDIFKTIKYGVTDKGMVAWEKTLTPKQISDVSNFILSLKGTNPAGAKAPQGNKEE